MFLCVFWDDLCLLLFFLFIFFLFEFVMCEFVLSLNDAFARFFGGVRLFDEDFVFSFFFIIDVGVGFNLGGEFDVFENDVFLFIFGIELNDRFVAFFDARLFDCRFGVLFFFCVMFEFCFVFLCVVCLFDVDDFFCVCVC